MEPNIQKYQAFVMASELGSFTEAARSLGYSQSGVSRMIADLEKDLQLILLERVRSGITLTSEGMAILPYAKRLCAEFDQFRIKAAELADLSSGLIRIGTFSSAATHWLPRIIRRFQEDYPGIDYELLSGDYKEIEGWIEEGRVDCGFLLLPVHSQLDTIELYRDQLLAILPEGHPYAEADSFPIAELNKEPFLLVEKDSKAEVAAFLERYDIEPHVHFRTWDDYAIMSMVESGLGISILPELILRRTPYHIITRPLDKPAYRRIGFAVRSMEMASNAVKRFILYLGYRDQR